MDKRIDVIGHVNPDTIAAALGYAWLPLVNVLPILIDLPYPCLPDGTRQAGSVASRKRQLLGVVLG